MELMVVDQGPEFAGEEFADFFWEQGVLVHFTDGQSPWQNGPTERAGGAFKEMLDKVFMDASPDRRGISRSCGSASGAKKCPGRPEWIFPGPMIPWQERPFTRTHARRRRRR